ncbi:glycosyltransferase family 4 protein [Ichthyenterobacterium magnum]|uniref:Glycosyltransferase involved in cell wall biosynthesis n=1 Tax=Ichthyenterobacterium magnum TaxID=1230530 RepID=A0A420DXA0_9FLAO|nr:glycosyltransferase family 1 protein [Ichthyenterobacterium magnum]RKE98836.1 glycosyltransferase involved in cell wall biosynthesis [Ichthyenterobacterium magnum]
MKIGIDAKWFFNGPPSGKVVVKQLLKELLSSTYKDEEFYVFLNKADKEIEFPYKRENIKCIYISSFNNLISNAITLPKYAKKHKLDVVLFQNFGTFSNIKSIVYIHDLLYLDYPQFYSLKERLYLSLLKPLAKKANTIVTISETEKNRIIKHKLGGVNNVHFVYHGVDKKFKPLDQHDKKQIEAFKLKYNLPNQFILYLGRLNIRKNIANLISAMQYVNTPLVIAGENDHKSEDLLSKIKTLGLQNKIIFTGYLEENELPLVYALATLFCFPSYAEGFGLPPLEAMASGTPVIVSDRTSLPEVCEDAGMYINPNDSLDIAKKINTLLASKEIINTFATKGVIQAKKFSWIKSAENLMNIIKTTNDS